MNGSNLIPLTHPRRREIIQAINEGRTKDAAKLMELKTHETGKPTTDRKQVKQYEQELTIRCSEWLKAEHPQVLYWHTPNGGHISKRYGAKVKRMGAKKGVPDFFIAEPVGLYSGLFVELKAEETNTRLTKEQTQMLQDLTKRGYMAVMCRGYKSFVECVTLYLTGRPKHIGSFTTEGAENERLQQSFGTD